MGIHRVSNITTEITEEEKNTSCTPVGQATDKKAPAKSSLESKLHINFLPAPLLSIICTAPWYT